MPKKDIFLFYAGSFSVWVTSRPSRNEFSVQKETFLRHPSFGCLAIDRLPRTKREAMAKKEEEEGHKTLSFFLRSFTNQIISNLLKSIVFICQLRLALSHYSIHTHFDLEL